MALAGGLGFLCRGGLLLGLELQLLRLVERGHEIVALADKLSNIRAIYRDFQVIGDKVWDLFCVKEASAHEWHFRGLARALRSLHDTFAYREFEETIDKVFKRS